MKIWTNESIKKINKWDKILIEKKLKEVVTNWANFDNMTYIKAGRLTKYYINLKYNPNNKLNYCFDSRDWNDDKNYLKRQAKEGVKND